MKKFYILLLVSLFTCLHILAIDKTTNMNPFAYNLSATLSSDQQTLTVKYSLNANARTVKVVFLNGSTIVKEVSCTGSLLNKTGADPYLVANQHSIDIPVGDLPVGTDVSWRIDVTGEGRAATQVYSQDGTNVYRYKFYRPSSVDIVQDPTSYNYGKVLVVESQHAASTKTGYHSSPKTKTNGNTDKQGAGIYVFNPDLTPRNNTSGTYVFNGKDDTRFPGTEFSPYRVRVSEDGRIFVSSLYKDGNILWEVPATFGEWTTVIGKEVAGTTWVGKNSSTGEENTDYCLNTSGGSFIAAPNAGLDVRGKGEYLKLLLLSCTGKAFGMGQAGFHTYEYNLGTAKTWNQTPSKDFKTNTSLFAHVNTSNVQYDKDGGIWCISYRGTCSETMPGLVHKTSTTTEDCRILRSGTKNAGLRFNKNFTRVIIASSTAGTLYDYDPTNHTASVGFFFNENNIDMSAVGSYLNDFAWDNANNIYAVGADHQDGGTGYVAVYCLKYSSSDVFSTPGPSAISKPCQSGQTFIVSTTTNNAAMGSVTGAGTYGCGDLVTLTATENDGYRFVNWTVGGKAVSTNKTYSFNASANITVQANFVSNVYNVEWYNLFQSDQDITEYIINPNSAMDGKTNSRLWRLFQVAFNEALKEKYPSGTLRSDQKNITPNSVSHYQVATFIAGNNANAIFLDFIGLTNNTNSKLTHLPFNWLAPYIKYALKQQGINSTSTDLTYWKGMLYRFFNRTDKAYTWDSNNSKVIAYNYGEGNFTDYGKPTYWRSWWAEYACDLYSVYSYDTPMPKNWTTSYTPTTSIQANDGSTLTPGNWYKWNPSSLDQDKLLAWYYGDRTKVPSQQINKTIVRNIDQDGYLFATWVDKLISEPKEKDQNNSDVIYLLNHHNGTHDIKIDRKMQGGMYNTLCLPFSVNESQLAAALPGATVMQFTGVDENLYDESGDPVAVLNFTQVTSMEAGVPYLVKPAADITNAITFSGVTTGYNGGNPIVIETAPEQTPISLGDGGSVTFQGTILSTKVYPGEFILVANDRIAQVTQTGDMAGMRGHFIINDPNLQTLAEQGRVYLSMKKPVTTSIPVAPEAEQQRKPEVRKIMRNGQIYIIRDGVTYTITGARVK